MLRSSFPAYFHALQKEKYNIKGYNKENNPSPEKKKRDELIGKLCGCIMLISTIVFFLIGILKEAWRYSYLAFVVGGILCAIAAIALSRGMNNSIDLMLTVLCLCAS